MTYSPRQLMTCAISCAIVLGAAHAQEEANPEPAPPAPMTSDEIREKQTSLSLEARDVERVLTKIKRASELAKTRVSDAAKSSELVSSAINKGDMAVAREDARKTIELYQEIIVQLEALLLEETPQRIMIARNLVDRLARMERQFAMTLDNADPMSGDGPNGPNGPDGNSGTNQTGMGTGKNPIGSKRSNLEDAKKGGEWKVEADSHTSQKRESVHVTGDPKRRGDPQKSANKSVKTSGEDEPVKELKRREVLLQRAVQMEKLGETLKDVLQSITKSTEPSDAEAMANVEAILKETELLKAIDEMKVTAKLVESGKLADARLATNNIADRMEIATQRLDVGYRQVIAPQAQQLRKLEQSLGMLREKLGSLETQAQIVAWHREARELLDVSEQLGINERTRDDLLNVMKQSGMSIGNGRDRFEWGFSNDRNEYPKEYTRPLVELQKEVQARIQSLIMADVSASENEVTHPKFQDLVDQYYKLLSGASDRKREGLAKDKN
jgi:hypothetical protein